VETDLRQRQEELRTAQAEAFDAAQQLSRARNEINALDLQKQGNVVRLEKLSAEKIQLEEERARLDARLEEFAATVEAGKLNARTQLGTVEERHQHLRELQSQLESVTAELDRLLQEQAEKKSRLNVLSQLQESHEGFTEATLAALAQSADVLGTLADRIRVPDEHVTAIEAALGHHLQLVLTNHPDAARAILSDLTARHKGRASLAPLEWQLPISDSVDSTDRTMPEGAIRALQVIDADPSVTPLLASLLARTLIVADLESATALWRESNGHFDLVTRTGELLNRHGVYTGGSSNSAQGPASTILGRKNQMAALEGEISSLQERVQECSRHKGSLQSEHTALQAEVQQAQIELRTQEVEIATRQGEFNALQNSQRSLAQKIDTVVYEIQSLAAQEQEGLQKRSTLAARVDELARQEQAAQDRVTSISEGLESLRQQRDQSQTTLTEIKVTLAGEEQNCSSLARQQVPLEQRIQELSQLIEHRRNELETGNNRRVQCEAESTESRREIGRLQHEREVVGAQTAELQGQRDRLDTGIAEREAGLRENRQRLSSLQEERGRFEVEVAQKQMSVQNLRERIQQKYQVNLDDIRGECITITYADGGSPRVETLTPEEVAASGAATDWDAVSEQVAALQKRVDEMGPVNLVAIDEYEETEQRHQFLTGQYDDLVKAREQLMEVINRINTQTREMFTDTFNRIRENFRSTFTEIFGGGKADLQLVDEGAVLESGIDIVARPPGKQLQSISLLSGGEQTMTAVALLFSIYQVKPSPFCVLDELDAPLDESNINRFVRILQRFLAHSQFIIITHNKRTIGMADVLYGVTMQEQGVSKIVSVKFHKSEVESADHQGNPLVPPPQSLQPVEEEEDAPHSREQTFDIVMAK
jgi:chromosome segregation protein